MRLHKQTWQAHLQSDPAGATCQVTGGYVVDGRLVITLSLHTPRFIDFAEESKPFHPKLEEEPRFWVQPAGFERSESTSEGDETSPDRMKIRSNPDFSVRDFVCEMGDDDGTCVIEPVPPSGPIEFTASWTAEGLSPTSTILNLTLTS